MRIVIPGGSGQVGTILARHFHAQNHDVSVLSRTPNERQKWRVAGWDGLHPGPWIDLLNGCDLLINLTGRSVNCRYGKKNRSLIFSSRVESTRLLQQVIGQMASPPRLWINASTATIYRHALDRSMDEISGELGGNEPGAPETWNFSIEVAKAWENAFFHGPAPGTRKVAIRSAMIFSADRGGVFDAFSGLVRSGLGGPQGSGEQYVSWIHELDFVRAIDFLVTHDSMNGVINLASPNPIPNYAFLQALRKAWGVSLAFPTSRWMLEVGAFLRRTESELILKSRRVVPTRLTEAGFRFVFPDWPQAAQDLVVRWRSSPHYKQ